METTTEKPFTIRFYKEEFFDEEKLYMEAATECLISEITCRVTLDNSLAEQTCMSSGTPSNTMDADIGSAFYDIIKDVWTENPGKEQEYFTFNLNTKITTTETLSRLLEAKHAVRVKNPLFGIKREEWPEWEEPQFDIPEIVKDKAPQKDDFTISVSPQYTEGDMWDFLDETAYFDLTVSSDKPIKKINVTANFMREQPKENLSVEVNPEAQSHELRIEVSGNLLDQVKGLGSFSHSEYEKFDYIFKFEIIDAEDKKHMRKVTAQLPNPYYKDIEAEKQIAREVLAEVFRKKYNEDIAELKIESQSGWWAWKKDDASFQYGWNDDEILLYRYFGSVDYDADQDEVWNEMQKLTKLTDGAGEFVYSDSYFVLKCEFGPGWIEADDLEKKLDEFEKFAESEELSKFLAAYEGEG
ncbi:hypothetical protein [Chryseobacterium sp. 2987]|uniref:hypothetical protein n=1 Tax=Chryseobacterium sp. 2987 TaxID=2817767 RepID=UPI002859E8E5|nr:hypothetical protein [Chryseobacterium sp. 2987]MDR6919800.1 hypothetical protein [Chryseobacterium sp. 2987]